MLIVIFNATFFVGLLWGMICQLSITFHEHHKIDHGTGHFNTNEFSSNGNIYKDRSKKDQTIALLYYAFTSLSTVGFGDYYP